MSVSIVKKLTVYAHKNDLDAVMNELSFLACVHVSPTDDEELSLETLECAETIADKSILTDIEKAISALEPYSKKKKGAKEKKSLKVEVFISEGNTDKAKKILARALEVSARREEIKKEISEKVAALTEARPYVEFELPLGFGGTDTTSCFYSKLPVETDLEASGKALYNAGAVSNLISKDKSGIYISYFCYKADSEKVEKLLSSYGFKRVFFEGVQMNARDFCRAAQRSLKALSEEAEALDKELKDSVDDNIDLLRALYDIVATEAEIARQKKKIRFTECVAVISGWIPEENEETVRAALDACECAYEISAPEGDDVPPVILRNKGFEKLLRPLRFGKAPGEVTPFVAFERSQRFTEHQK